MTKLKQGDKICFAKFTFPYKTIDWGGATIKPLATLTLVFAVIFLVFSFGPPLLGIPFTPYPLMKIADVFDIFTPLVLLPLYWLLYRSGQKEPLKLPGIIVFFMFAAFWVEGQGIHLSANSVGHLLEGMKNSDVFKLTYFYDEVLGHYLWHLGVVGLSAVIIYRQWQNPATGEKALTWSFILAGVIHGFSLFSVFLEGGTAPLGLSFSVLLVLFFSVWGRKRIRQQPLIMFFFISYAVAVIFFAGWSIFWGGLPQFSEVGII